MHASQYYFGVIGTPQNTKAGLSRKGRSNYYRLSSEIGRDRLCLIEISARLLKKGPVQLEAKEIGID